MIQLQNIDLNEQSSYSDPIQNAWLKDHPDILEINETDHKAYNKLRNAHTNERAAILSHVLHNGTPEQVRWAGEMFWKETVGFIKKILKEKNLKSLSNYSDILQSVYTYWYSQLHLYDPERPGTTYYKWARYQIEHAATRSASTEKYQTTPHKAERNRRVERALEKLRANGIEHPTAAQIQASLGSNFSISTVEDALHSISFSNPASYEKFEENIRMSDDAPDIESTEYIPHIEVEKRDKAERLKTAIDSLPDEERICIMLKYGFGDQDIVKSTTGTATDTDIARITGFSVAKVKYYLRKAERHIERNPDINSYFADRQNSAERLTRSNLYEKFFDDRDDDINGVIDGIKPDPEN